MPQIDLHMFQYTLWPLPIFRLINRVIIMSGVKELNRYPCLVQIQKIIYLVWVMRLRFSEKPFQITCTIYAVILVTLLLLGRFSGKKKIEQNGVKRIASLTTPQPLTWTLWLPMVVSVDYYREAPPFINQSCIRACIKSLAWSKIKFGWPYLLSMQCHMRRWIVKFFIWHVLKYKNRM